MAIVAFLPASCAVSVQYILLIKDESIQATPVLLYLGLDKLTRCSSITDAGCCE